MTIDEWLKQYGTIAVVSAIAGAIATAILTKLIPYLWTQGGNLISKLGKAIGGSFAYHEFEKKYLDWVVTELRELKLTGIVTNDDSKKPLLEQVFVSLSVGKEKFLSRDKPDVVVNERVTEYLDKLYETSYEWIVTETESLQVQLTRNLEISKSLRASREFLESAELHLRERGLRERIRYAISKFLVNIDSETPVLGVLARTLLRNLIARQGKDTLSELIYKLDFSSTEQIQQLLKEHNRIAILGAPGSGKTTFLQYIALAYARERAGDQKLRKRGILKERLSVTKWRLPLFIPLSSIAGALVNITPEGRDLSIVDLLPRILPPDFQKDYKDIAVNYFSHQLRKGNCVILLDGLDEVPTDNEFNAVVRAIESLALRYERNQFVVTSRIAGWRSGVGADFNVFYVSDLSDDQVNIFIDSWYSAVERNAVIGRLEDEGEAERKARERRAAQRAYELKRTLKENSGIRGLATNPMLLSIIALVHRSLATLPKERSKLYSECSKILLEQWDFSRGIRVDDTNLKLEQKEAIVRRIAIALHTGEIGEKGGGREANYSDVLKIIIGILPGLGRQPEDATRLLQRLIERSGIITERKRGVLTFAHLTFQEYFTAQYLALGEHIQHQEFLLDKENLLSDWWREVILLYSGLLSDSSNFIQQIWNDGVEDDLCQQRLRLAGFCLAEAVEVKNIEVRQQLVPDLLKVRTQGNIKSVNQTMPANVENHLTRWAKESQWYENAAICRMQENNDEEELLKALDDQQKSVRQAVLTYLKNSPTGPLSEKLINKIIALTNDKDADIRKNAIESVGAIGKTTGTDMIVNHLAKLLKSEDDATRETATKSILMLENTFVLKPSMINIEVMLKSDNVKSRNTAARILPLFDAGDLLQCFEEFVKLLSDTDGELRRHAKASLKKIIELHKINIPLEKILSLLEMPDANIRASAIDALSMLDQDSLLRYAVIDKIFDHVGDKDLGVRNAITVTLRQVYQKGLGEEIISKLLNILDTGDINTKIQAINIIGKLSLKPVPDSVKEKVFVALTATDAKLRIAAAEVISIVDTSPFVEETVENLIKALHDKDSSFQVACLRAFGTLIQYARSKEVAEILSKFLEMRNEKVRIAAANALAQLNIGEINPKALDILIKGARGRSIGHSIQQTMLRSSVRHNDLRWELEFDVEPSFQASACSALATMNMEKDRILSTLREVVENKRNAQNVIRQALLAYARVGSNMNPERTMNEVSHLLEKDLELTNALLRDQLSRLRNFIWRPSRFERDDKRIDVENPFKLICERLSEEVATRRLSSIIRNGQTNNRALALLTIAQLNNDAVFDAILDVIKIAIDDKEEIVRLTALQALESLVEKKARHDLCILISKRLADENRYIHTKAWEILLKTYTSLGVWN
jgi:HEAT repeat protein